MVTSHEFDQFIVGGHRAILDRPLVENSTRDDDGGLVGSSPYVLSGVRR